MEVIFLWAPPFQLRMIMLHPPCGFAKVTANSWSRQLCSWLIDSEFFRDHRIEYSDYVRERKRKVIPSRKFASCRERTAESRRGRRYVRSPRWEVYRGRYTIVTGVALSLIRARTAFEQRQRYRRVATAGSCCRLTYTSPESHSRKSSNFLRELAHAHPPWDSRVLAWLDVYTLRFFPIIRELSQSHAQCYNPKRERYFCVRR